MLAPSNLAAVHASSAAEPEECTFLFSNSFSHSEQFLLYFAPHWSAYLDSAEHEQRADAVYRYYRTQLQVLQWQDSFMPRLQGKGPVDRRPRRWLLKAPIHMRYLPSLVKAFPDASIVWTHRRLPSVVASFCSLVQHLRCLTQLPSSPGLQPPLLGREMLHLLSRLLAPALSYLQQSEGGKGKGRVAHIAYQELLDDPLGAVQRVYDTARVEWTEGVRKAVVEYMQRTPQYKHGSHNYTLQHYGLSEDEVHSVFANYEARFKHLL